MRADGEDETGPRPAAAGVLERELQERLFAPLAQMRRRCRLYLALTGLRGWVRVLLVAGVGQLALDHALRLSLDQRAVLTVALALAGLSWAYRRMLGPLLCPLPNRFLAGLVDRAHPELCHQLATAVQLAGDGALGIRGADRRGRMVGETSPGLVRSVLESACRSAARVTFLRVLDHGRATRCGIELLALLLVVVAALGFLPELTGTWLARNWLLHDVPWPQRTYIWPDGFGPEGHRRMARGDMVEITAGVTGVVPSDAVCEWRTSSGRQGREPMSIVGETQLSAALGQLAEDLHFRISGGDERTREFTLEAVDRPRVTHTLAQITPPAYTHSDPLTIEQQTVLEMLTGSTLTLTARLNKPVKTARFVGSDGTNVAGELTCSSEDNLEPWVSLHWADPISGTYRFELIDADDLSSQNPVRYTLRVAPDRPPGVQMELPGVGELVAPQAVVPVELRAQDTYGLSDVRLCVQAGSRSERAATAAGFVPGVRNFATKLTLAIAAYELAPGDTLRLRAEGADADPRGPNVGSTPVTSLRVVSRDEFQAEMARRELVLRQEFERLRSAQGRLNDALERLLAALPPETAPPDAMGARLAGLARNQTEQGGGCLAVARGFAQVLAEMQVSRVARATDERRITERVVGPLERLGREASPAAAATLAAIRETPVTELRGAALAAQRQLLRQMDDILANMLEWEGYREAVTLLQEIIEAQGELRTDTLRALERQLDDILGSEEPGR